MKKIVYTYCVRILLFVGMIGIHSPNLKGMEPVAAASAHMCTDPTTEEILYIVHTFLTPDGLLAAHKKGAIDIQMMHSMAMNAHLLSEKLRQADTCFINVPGFKAYKTKILESLRKFIACIDQSESCRLERVAAVISTMGSVMTEIQELEVPVLQKFAEIPSSTSDYSQWIKAKYPINKKVETPESIAHRKKHELYSKALKLKQDYLQQLLMLAKLENDVTPYERTALGLTVAHADAFERAQCKKEKEQKDKVQPTKPATKPGYFDSLAHTIRCRLYELEAAFIAQDHEETILAFGPTLKLYFDSARQPALMKKIFSCVDFLNPTLVDGKIVLTQEFDLVTNKKIIECKSLERSGPDDYKDELLREQFMIAYADRAEEQQIEVGSDTLDIEDLVHKPVVCYARCMKNFLQEEKKRQPGRRAETPQELITANLLTKREEELTLAERDEIRQLVLRTCAEVRNKTSQITDEGFSCWDGNTYHHVLKILHTYEMPTIAEIKELKKLIRIIGEENFALHIVAPTSLHKRVEMILDNLSVRRKKGIQGHPGHRRSPSADCQRTGSTFDQAGDDTAMFGKLHALRNPISLNVFDFSIPGSCTFGSPQKLSPQKTRPGSPINRKKTQRRLMWDDQDRLPTVFKPIEEDNSR